MARAATTCLPGDIYGDWTVVGDSPDRGSDGKRRVLVRCAAGCGETAVVRSAELGLGRARRCVCQSGKPKPKPTPKPKQVKRNPDAFHPTRDAPVVEVFRSDSVRMVRVDCPFCPGEHTHAAPDDLLPSAPMARSSKCKGTGTGGIYRIVGVPGVGEEAA
ncbi:hypothetical protein [Nocardioides panzhihuensis]|uniref:Uncharacterized protein n=1 Tax=Nocardioides panzhihuensis TaxID=860243 RepID=A0A7Z0IR95_9ACTN|nr:hypothetical protein [Nocardioides panzhihuensis]NYI76626.1 hypothetical protein [Nocardioides panzhihuensis]